MHDHLIGLNTKILENPQHYRIREPQNDSSYYDSLTGGITGYDGASFDDSAEGFYLDYRAMGFQKNIQLGKQKKICQKRSLSVDKTSSNAFMGATKRSQARGGSKPPRALDSGGKSGSSGGESGKSFESKNANKFREDLRLDRQFFKQLLKDPTISKDLLNEYHSIQREVSENPNKKEIRGQIGIREFL